MSSGPLAALSRIAAVSGRKIDPPTLMPVRVIADLSGEAMRARLCAFTDAVGEELALRPDFTTPIARDVAAGALAPSRYHYAGTVWRLPQPGSDQPIEFEQIGFEWFGGGGVDEDAEAAVLTLAATQDGGSRDAQVRLGDVGVFRALIDALGFSPLWADRLKRAFSRRVGPKQLLAAAMTGDTAPSPLAQGLAAMSVSDAAAAVEEMFALAGVQPVGGRSASEIAERLRDRAEDRPPPAASADLLSRYLDLTAPIADADRGLAEIAAQTKRISATAAGLDAAIDVFLARVARIAAAKPPFWIDARFGAEAGRRFQYYDGLVFEIARAGAWDRPIGGGGRYDGLIARLAGGARAVPAIGAALSSARMGGAA